MPRSKARFNGSDASAPLRPPETRAEFSQKVRATLRALHPEAKDAPTDSQWPHPADDFIEALQDEARWAFHSLQSIRSATVKGDLLVECDSILRRLNSLARDLVRLTPSLDAALPIAASPLDVADSIAKLVSGFVTARSTIKRAARQQSHPEASGAVALELTVRLLRVAAEKKNQDRLNGF